MSEPDFEGYTEEQIKVYNLMRTFSREFDAFFSEFLKQHNPSPQEVAGLLIALPYDILQILKDCGLTVKATIEIFNGMNKSSLEQFMKDQEESK